MSNDPPPAARGALDAGAPLQPTTSQAAAIPADAGAMPAPEPDREAGAVTGTEALDAAAPAAPVAPVAPAAPAAPVAPADATSVISRARRRGLAVLAGVTRLLRFALVLAIFAVGIALGYQAYLSSQPPPTGPAADPATAATEPPPVVREFIAAVGSNDADGIRSAVPADPYKSFTSEIARWEFQEVTSVETLTTYVDGIRTATAFMMIGRDSAGNPIAINLVVETEAGNIVAFK